MMIERTRQLRCCTGRTVVRRNGFTLTEILVVIGIIVLMLGLAVPAFNIMRGSRSIEGAENQLSAMLARARTEALGNQNTGGVFFFVDPRTPDRVSCAAVEQVQISPAAMLQNNATRDIYLDLVPDRDFLVLPPGVGLQLINDFATDTNGVRIGDAYIGYNNNVSFNGSNRTTNVQYGGVILFDSAGRLLSQSYAFRIRQEGTNGNLAAPSAMGNLLFYINDPTSPINNTVMGMTTAFVEPGASTLTAPEEYPRSQFGLVLFDQPSFQNAGGADDDMVLSKNPPPQQAYLNSKEAAEETWIDKNATPLLINRYNGTLTRGGT